MGTNACWIQLRLGRTITPERIRDEIEVYWTAKGARVLAREVRPLEPLRLEKTKTLGYAIGGIENGWVEVLDSERYTADFGLARHLARKLKTHVHFIGVWDVDQTSIERWIAPPGATKKKPAMRGLPMPSLYYAELVAKPDLAAAAIVFKGVRYTNYDPGPEPEEEPPLEPEKNYLASHQAVAKALDAKKALALLKGALNLEPCLTVFLGQALDLDDASARRFTLAIAPFLLCHPLSTVRLTRIAEAAAREGDDATLDAVRAKLTPPPRALLSVIAKRLEQRDEHDAARRLRAMAPSP
ncbi:MAG: hypothetical protein KIT84_37985 [Labilithrix sp.]|nr:hypothetical protein [Labilithrix sp.]MCW5816849.1 hypothetical protein [Labilithrix sp.]